MISRIKIYFNQGQDRSVKAKKNIIGMLFLKGLSILLSLLIVPMTINYISTYQYGIWLTLSSLIGWLSFFDIGFGNGLKNKLVEAIALGKDELAKIYVSTTYVLLSIIIAGVYIIASIATFFIDWSRIFNAPNTMLTELAWVVLIVLTTFCFQFILNLLNIILTALQKPALPSLFNTISQLLVALLILILIHTTKGSLVYLSIAIGVANTIVLAVCSVWFFSRGLKKYCPSFKHVKFYYAKDLMHLGLKFFILQIIALVYYQTNNIIITQILSPIDVTTYNISFKYMSIISMIFTIVITPFWSAFTEAETLKDYKWMKSVTKKLRLFFCFVIIGIILMVVFSPIAYNLWLGNQLYIPFGLTILMGFWQVFNIWVSLHSQLIYGFGKIRLQLISSLICGVLNLPLTIYFCHEWQLNGVVFAQILLSAANSWVGIVQLNKLLNKSAYGIWGK